MPDKELAKIGLTKVGLAKVGHYLSIWRGDCSHFLGEGGERRWRRGREEEGSGGGGRRERGREGRQAWPKKVVAKESRGQRRYAKLGRDHPNTPFLCNPWELQLRVNRHDCSASHHLRFVPGLLFGQLRALPPTSSVKTTKRPLREFLPIHGASWLLCSTLANSENETEIEIGRNRRSDESCFFLVFVPSSFLFFPFFSLVSAR